MKRNEEAIISQTTITLKKTIFVEGKLDYKLFTDFLKSQSITGVRVIEISQFIDDSHLPIEERDIAKDKIKNLIIKCNEEGNLKNKYLGIIDLDYDYFQNRIQTINNLYYTDYHCIESYFLDVDLINVFLNENDLEDLTELDFSKWLDNTLMFSSYFYFQLLHLQTIHKDDHLSFSDLNICNSSFTDYKKKKILLTPILRAKTKNYPRTVAPFITFIKTLDRTQYQDVKMLFLHGKHTLAFVIGVLKGVFKNIKNITNEHIINALKDKFLLFKFYQKYKLFDTILIFSNDRLG